MQLARSGSGGDNSFLCEGESSTNRGLHLVERGTRLYFGQFGDDLQASPQVSAGVWYHVAFVKEGRQQVGG